MGGQPEQCLTDAGYRKEEDLQALEEKDINGYVSLRREGKGDAKPDETLYLAAARMARKLATPEGRAIYSQRKHLVEAVNGWIKNILGFRQFSLRGRCPFCRLPGPFQVVAGKTVRSIRLTVRNLILGWQWSGHAD